MNGLTLPSEDITRLATFVADILPVYQAFGERVSELSHARDDQLRQIKDLEDEVNVRRYFIWEEYQNSVVAAWADYQDKVAAYQAGHPYPADHVAAAVLTGSAVSPGPPPWADPAEHITGEHITGQPS